MAYGTGHGRASDALKLEKHITCLKYTLFCFNVIIWIVGVSMVGLTLWLKTEPGFNEWVNDLSIEEFFSGLYVLLAGGLVIMLVAFLGCCGALMENRVLLYAFMGTQALGFVLGLAGSAVLLDFSTINSRIEPLIRQAMRNLIASSNNPRAASTLHMIQENVGCCGADGPSDYMSLKQPLSGSCRDTVTGNVYFYGCVDELTWFLQDKAAWICALAMLVCFINVLNCALTLTLIQALKKEEDDALKR